MLVSAQQVAILQRHGAGHQREVVAQAVAAASAAAALQSALRCGGRRLQILHHHLLLPRRRQMIHNQAHLGIRQINGSVRALLWPLCYMVCNWRTWGFSIGTHVYRHITIVNLRAHSISELCSTLS